MLIECFSVLQGLASETVSDDVTHHIEHAGAAPPSIAEKVGFDFEATVHQGQSNWTTGQKERLKLFPEEVREGMLSNLEKLNFSFMNERSWMKVYRVLLEHFRHGDREWEELLFKLWTMRVLNYTIETALHG